MNMLRIVARICMGIALAGFLIPATFDDAEAGKRYKRSGHSSSYGKRSHGARRHSGYRSGGIMLRIPNAYSYDDAVIIGYEPGFYRGGPKIINVPETLRRRRERELSRSD